jgi:hypothetical protein
MGTFELVCRLLEGGGASGGVVSRAYRLLARVLYSSECKGGLAAEVAALVLKILKPSIKARLSSQ